MKMVKNENDQKLKCPQMKMAKMKMAKNENSQK